MTKNIAKTGASQLPDFMKDHAGEGQEAITREDIKMPRLKLGQSMTPEVKDKMAEEGDLIHNITKQVLCAAGNTLPAIPVCYNKEYIIWYDRKGPNGGGIAARAQRQIMPDGAIRYIWDKPGIEITDKLDGKMPVKYQLKTFTTFNADGGDDNTDTLAAWGSQVPGDRESKPAATCHHNYVFMLPEHDEQMIAVSMSKTSAKKAEEFNTMLKMGKIPTYARIYKLSTFIDQSDDNKFANYQFGGFEPVQDEEQFNELRKMYLMLKEKGVDVDFSDEEGNKANQEDNGKF